MWGRGCAGRPGSAYTDRPARPTPALLGALPASSTGKARPCGTGATFAPFSRAWRRAACASVLHLHRSAMPVAPAGCPGRPGGPQEHAASTCEALDRRRWRDLLVGQLRIPRARGPSYVCGEVAQVGDCVGEARPESRLGRLRAAAAGWGVASRRARSRVIVRAALVELLADTSAAALRRRRPGSRTCVARPRPPRSRPEPAMHRVCFAAARPRPRRGLNAIRPRPCVKSPSDALARRGPSAKSLRGR